MNEYKDKILFMIIKSKYTFITVFTIIGILLISGCVNEKNGKKLGDEVLNIKEAVPAEWNYTLIVDFTGEVTPADGYGKIATQTSGEIDVPHGLWKPVAVVNFVNPSKEIGYYPGMKTENKYHTSLQLYFYDITEKQRIMEVIDKEKIYSWCIPTYFDETEDYVIVTSPCHINCGIKTEEAINYFSPLEKSLKTYFDKF